MYTSEGKYFTGEKVTWHVTSDRAGNVKSIHASVCVWDNEGTKFTTPERQLTPDEQKHALVGFKEMGEVVEKLAREAYEQHLDAVAFAAAGHVDSDDKPVIEVEEVTEQEHSVPIEPAVPEEVPAQEQPPVEQTDNEEGA